MCPLDKTIPIWLIVCGCIAFVITIIGIIDVIMNSEEVTCVGCILCSFILFFFMWMVPGAVFIYGNWNEYQAYNRDPTMYPQYECQPAVYLMSFTILSIVCIVLGLLGAMLCIVFFMLITEDVTAKMMMRMWEWRRERRVRIRLEEVCV